MVHQQVPGQGGQPRGKCPFFKVIAAHRPVDPDKNLLRQVLRVVRGVGKPITQVVNTPVVQTYNLLPCSGVACQASANKCSCLLLFQAVSPIKDTYRYLLWFTLWFQNGLMSVSEKVYRKQG